MVSPISLSLMRPGGTNLGWLVRGPDGALPYMQAQYDLDRGWFNGKAYGTLSAFNAAASGTFSRASDGSYFGADGLLKTAGPNVLRLTHDPATGKALGYLAEAQATNLWRQSGNLSASGWSWLSGTGIVTAGDNSIFGGSLWAIDLGSASDRRQNNTVPANTQIAISFACKRGNQPVARVEVHFTGGTGTQIAAHVYNFDTGSLTVNGSAGITIGSYRRTIYPSGEVLIESVVTPSNGSTTAYTLVHVGTSSSEVTQYGRVQLEVGAYPTSYIPTTTAAVTRLADSLAYDMAGPPEGTVVVEGRAAPGLGSQVLWQWDDDSEANRYRIIRGLSGNARLIVTTGGTDNVNLDMGALANNTDYRIAASFKSGSYSASLNGAAAATSSYAGSLPSVSKMRVGQSKAGDQASATIARTIDFTKAYTAAQVAGMSAL